MRIYVVALGVLVGVIYAPLDVRSPAPPVVALVGLMGEQVVPMAKRLLAGEPISPISVGWLKTDCVPHIFGELPTKSKTAAMEREVRT